MASYVPLCSSTPPPSSSRPLLLRPPPSPHPSHPGPPTLAELGGAVVVGLVEVELLPAGADLPVVPDTVDEVQSFALRAGLMVLFQYLRQTWMVRAVARATI